MTTNQNMTEPYEILQYSTRHVGQEVRVFDELTSTNDYVTQLAVPGLAIVADRQTQGRGQYGRQWLGEPGTSLLVSFTINPPANLCRPVILTAWVAVAVAEAILELTKVQARVKWPNDLLIRGKKVCGILIEQKQSVTIGTGLNLSQSAEHFVEAGLPDASSLQLATGVEVARKIALESVIRHLDNEYERLLSEGTTPLEADWKWRIGLLGRPVRVEMFDGSPVYGRLMDMSFDEIRLDARTIRPELIRHIKPS